MPKTMPKNDKLGDIWKAKNKTAEIDRLSTKISSAIATTDFKYVTDTLKRMSYVIGTNTSWSLCYSDTARRLTAAIFKEKYNLYTKFIFSHSKRIKGRVRRYYSIEISPLPFK